MKTIDKPATRIALALVQLWPRHNSTCRSCHGCHWWVMPLPPLLELHIFLSPVDTLVELWSTEGNRVWATSALDWWTALAQLVDYLRSVSEAIAPEGNVSCQK